jgi:hypothetical protein
MTGTGWDPLVKIQFELDGNLCFFAETVAINKSSKYTNNLLINGTDNDIV